MKTIVSISLCLTNYFNIPINKYKYGRLGKNKTNHGAGRI